MAARSSTLTLLFLLLSSLAGPAGRVAQAAASSAVPTQPPPPPAPPAVQQGAPGQTPAATPSKASAMRLRVTRFRRVMVYSGHFDSY